MPRLGVGPWLPEWGAGLLGTRRGRWRGGGVEGSERLPTEGLLSVPRTTQLAPPPASVLAVPFHLGHSHPEPCLASFFSGLSSDVTSSEKSFLSPTPLQSRPALSVPMGCRASTSESSF